MSLPNQNIETWSRKGCVGCCLCEGGSRQIGRTAVLAALALFTMGLGLLALPFFKRCVYCGHNTFMNSHSPHAAAPQPQPAYQPPMAQYPAPAQPAPMVQQPAPVAPPQVHPMPVAPPQAPTAPQVTGAVYPGPDTYPGGATYPGPGA